MFKQVRLISYVFGLLTSVSSTFNSQNVKETFHKKHKKTIGPQDPSLLFSGNRKELGAGIPATGIKP